MERYRLEEICLRASDRLKLETILVANQRLQIPPGYPHVSTVRGDEYTVESIGERLSVRNFMDSLPSTGVETGGHAAYGARDKQKFANALDRALTRARTRRG